MKHHFVKTTNHARFMAAVSALDDRGSREQGILLLTGYPGTGKSTTVDNWGSQTDALYLEGVPGMSLRYLKDAIRQETGLTGKGAYEEFRELTDYLRDNRVPMILDESQHGLNDKAECIEYLRRAAEKADVVLVLVCHTSERNRFHKPAHIRTRIGGICELERTTPADTAALCRELCEVVLADEVIHLVHVQANGLPRNIGGALPKLERIARKLGKDRLDAADIAGHVLVENWEKKLQGTK